ncbi:MAG TPA: (deoxy)nucleoside triphosphate pyrophosphohydrolase [Syntrophales bacterium]|jgi:8-oxo-dGTP diphosphatase|nr:(deoxy)nucleoside triphosphate pyrophosphohydrolase [Syntrophales bacterium]HQA83585.1 (deoxy)nucleoside triphosphate pyrophosphohydrolase [Syntrophales bacterium]
MKTVTAAILFHEGKILIARRRDRDRLAGKWEFPGGTVEPGETPECCLRREMKEEFDIDIEVGTFFGESVYHYNHGSICLLAYLTRWRGGTLSCRDHDACAWVSIPELPCFDFSPADLPFVDRLLTGKTTLQ